MYAVLMPATVRPSRAPAAQPTIASSPSGRAAARIAARIAARMQSAAAPAPASASVEKTISRMRSRGAIVPTRNVENFLAKRHPALISLSHDHHHGLALALRLRLGRRALLRDGWTHDVREQRERLREFFHEELRPHFAAEERALFPGLRTAVPGAAPLLDRLTADHREMEERLVQIGYMEPADLQAGLAAMGEVLEAHIRLEERELFTTITAGVSAEILGEIGGRVEAERRAAVEAGRFPAYAESACVVPVRAERVFDLLTAPTGFTGLFPPEVEAQVSGPDRLRPGAMLTLTLFGERTMFLLDDVREDARLSFRAADQRLRGTLRLDCSDVRGGRQVRCAVDLAPAGHGGEADPLLARAASVLARAIPERVQAVLAAEGGR